MKDVRVCFRGGIFLCLLAAALSAVGQPVYNNLHEFVSGSTTDGAFPGGLLTDGNILWGATAQGGSQSSGMIYSIATNGTGFTPVYNFTDGNDGVEPNELLLAGGTFFGTTYLSDEFSGQGSVYRFDTNTATLTVLHSFTNSPDGAQSTAGLVLSGATLFGTTESGGANGSGTVFKLATNGANYTILHNFSGAADGGTPRGRLSLIGSRLYGTTSLGGTNNSGTIFTMDTNGNNFSLLYTFSSNPPAASVPYAGLTSDGAGKLYGVSTSGGLGTNEGTIFAIGTNGGFNIIYSFTNEEAISPQGQLLFTNGMLYGNALGGGAALDGVVFQIATNGANFMVLYNFTNATTGGNPIGSMVLRNNVIFGVTYLSGPNGGGTVYSLQLSPFITQQPQSQNVPVGDPVTLTAVGGGLGTLGYQWYTNGVPVPGATSSTLSYGSVTTNQSGSYTLVVTNFTGSVTSSPAVLTVQDVPSITGQPQSESVTNGGTASFSVTAVNGPLTYQWYYDTNTLLGGQTGSTLTLPGVTTNNAGAYTVVVANNIGTSTSAPAILTVTVVSLPVITQQPQNLIVTNGNPVSFSVTATGSGTLAYQWYSNSVNTAIGLPLLNQTGSTYSFTAVTNANNRYYSVVVTNLSGSVTSTPALLTVISKPLITVSPASTSVGLSNTVNLAVVALGANLRYQWYSNTVATALGTALSKQTNSTYSFTAYTSANGHYYTVVVTNSFGRATSSPPAQLTVISAPVILTNPAATTVDYGGATNFSVTAIGAITLKYQWYFNTNTVLPAQTNSTLLIPDATNSLAGYYSVIVTNLYGRATSAPALLTIASPGSLPVIILQPEGATIPLGGSITFISSATNALGYQWLFNTNALIAGANTTNLVITGANQPGYYAMVATNNFGAATSSPALLTLTGQAIVLSSAFDRASGSYSFDYVNIAGSANRLWATTNLADPNAWQVIATDIMATNGTWNYTDPNTAQINPVRFYRFTSP